MRFARGVERLREFSDGPPQVSFFGARGAVGGRPVRFRRSENDNVCGVLFQTNAPEWLPATGLLIALRTAYRRAVLAGDLTVCSHLDEKMARRAAVWPGFIPDGYLFPTAWAVPPGEGVEVVRAACLDLSLWPVCRDWLLDNGPDWLAQEMKKAVVVSTA